MCLRPDSEAWADYFEKRKIQYAFFSAANGIALQEERARREEAERLAALDESDSEDEDSDADSFDEDLRRANEDSGIVPGMKIPKSGNKLNARGPSQGKAREQERELDREENDEDTSDDEDDETGLAKKMRRGVHISTPGSDESARTRILSVLELEDMFLSRAPEGEIGRGTG